MARQNNREMRLPMPVMMDPEDRIALDRPVRSQQDFLLIVIHSLSIIEPSPRSGQLNIRERGGGFQTE
jgi:hypothetical protein